MARQFARNHLRPLSTLVFALAMVLASETVLAQNCIIHYANNVPMQFENTSYIEIPFDVDLSLPLDDINVFIDIENPKIRNLTFTLISPEFYKVTLYTGPLATFYAATEMKLYFNDEATANLQSVLGASGWSYKGYESLDTLQRREALGRWTLAITNPQPNLPTIVKEISLRFNCPGSKPVYAIEFADHILEQEVRKAGKIQERPGTLYNFNLEQVVNLNASYRNITNLSGIEHCVNLEKLHFYSNKITDLSPVTGLSKLTSLNLSDNFISDVSALSELYQLEHLGLDRNNIEDISSLSGLTKIKSLGLENNSISDISPLLTMTKVKGLDLGRNNISDISALAYMTELYELNVSSNELVNITPLSSCISLSSLKASFNDIADISPLVGLHSLTSVELAYNEITDASPLSALPNLWEVRLSHNEVKEFPRITSKKLTTLWLDHNKLESLKGIEFIEDARNFRYLYIHNNNISDISNIRQGSTFNSFAASNNKIMSIEALRGAKIEYLALEDNEIVDIEPLIHNEWARYLDLDFNKIETLPEPNEGGYPEYFVASEFTLVSNQITNADLLSNLAYTDFLDISGNKIPNLNFLSNGPKLSYLAAANNRICFLNPLTGQYRLEALNVHSNFIADLTPIQNLRGLRALNIDRNEVHSLNAISELRSLVYLSVSANRFTELWPITPLHDLEYLDISENKLEAVNEVSDLHSLKDLYLYSNILTKLPELAGLTNLDTLDASSNRLTDISTLASASSSLRSLQIYNNRLTDIGPLIDGRALGERDFLNIEMNPVQAHVCEIQVPLLLQRGVQVEVDACGTPPVASCIEQLSYPSPGTAILAESLNIGSVDEDGDELSFSIQGQSSYMPTCQELSAGEFEVVLEVSDGIYTSTCKSTVTLNYEPEGECDEGELAEQHSHSADISKDGSISMSELLRVVQFYNLSGPVCARDGEYSEDGYTVGAAYFQDGCPYHDSDFAYPYASISMVELLRLIQIYNAGAYQLCSSVPTEDGFCLK